MLDDLTTEQQAEEESTGKVAIYSRVYKLMRCPGPPCPNRDHCWPDPDFGHQHRKLSPHHLRMLITHVQDGGKLDCYDDVPQAFRQQLRDEDERRESQKQKKTATMPYGRTPVNIYNNYPEQAQTPASSNARPEPSVSARSPLVLLTGTPLNVPGAFDTTIKRYCEYLKSVPDGEAAKAEVDKACKIVLEKGLDIDQLYADQKYDFLMQGGVNEGTARRFVGGLLPWAERQRRE